LRLPASAELTRLLSPRNILFDDATMQFAPSGAHWHAADASFTLVATAQAENTPSLAEVDLCVHPQSDRANVYSVSRNDPISC
jgi:hypothetical protein